MHAFMKYLLSVYHAQATVLSILIYYGIEFLINNLSQITQILEYNLYMYFLPHSGMVV